MSFFHIMQESKGKRVAEVAASKDTLRKLGCSACPLDKERLRHPKMVPTGSDKPVLYFMGEAPGAEEDDEGEQFVGTSGRMIRSRIPSSLKKSIRWNNTIRCRPPKNRTPSDLEIECCRKLQEDDIAATKPKAVVGFGGIPLHWMLKLSGIKDLWRGRRVACSIKGHAFWYYPMLHPSFVLRMGGESWKGKEWLDVFGRDLKQVFSDVEAGLCDDPPTVYTDEQLLSNITQWKPGDSTDHWCNRIVDFAAGNVVGFDIETTGLNPYPHDARILTAAFGRRKTAIAFPLHHPEAKLGIFEVGKLTRAMKSALRKAERAVCHKAEFEQEWLIVKTLEGDRFVHEVDWGCTLAQAYVLDERKGGHSLDVISTYLLGNPIKSMFNLDMGNLAKEPLDKVLPYNAVDTKATAIAWFLQNKLLAQTGQLQCAEHYYQWSRSFALLMSRGLVPNGKVIRQLHREYTEQIEELTDTVMSLPEVKAFRRRNGEFVPGNPDHILGVLQKEYGIPVPDTQDGTLAALKNPFANAVRDLREIITLDSRYVAPLAAGEYIQDDGRIHARYSATRTDTGRSASEDPNAQNYPKREHKEVRGVITVPKKYKMVAVDYGQIQVRNIGMLSKDRVLVKQLWENADMHGDWLDKIMKAYPRWAKAKGAKEDPKRRKYARDCVKNEWTFPLFFGASLASTSGYLGIPEGVMEPLYNEFWGQYAGVLKWQEQMKAMYKQFGYVEDPIGRRRHWAKGKPLGPNEIINTTVQGAEADIVFDAMARLDRLAYERKEPWLGAVLEVHDDLTFYIPDIPRVFNEATALITKTMCLSPFKWINVPILVEMSVGDRWDTLQEVKKVWSTDYGHTLDTPIYKLKEAA